MSVPSAAPSRARPVRWTLADLLVVGGVTIVLGALMLLLLRVPGALGLDLRPLLESRPLVISMIAGGLIYGFAVVATYLVIVRRRHGSWSEIGFRAPPLLLMLLTPVIFAAQMTLIVMINLAMTAIIGQFENPQIDALTDPNGFSWLSFATVFIVGAIVAPIVEELVFRGLLYQWLRARLGVVAAVLLSAALFAGIHFIPLLLPALFAVGLVLAIAFELSGSLWVNITLHFMQNALAISALFLIQANPQLIPQP